MRSSGKLGDVQVLRAFCIVVTALNHVQFLVFWDTEAVAELFGRFGFWGGVDVFFVISGFVIARSFLPTATLERDGEGYWVQVVAFWIRRAYRILPSAALWLIVPLVLSIVLGPTIFMSPWANAYQAISGLFQVANFHHWFMASGRAEWPANSIYWSLSLEEQFYLLLPVCFFLFRRRFVLFCGAVALAQVFVPRVHGDLTWSIRTDGFMCGILLYYLSTTRLHARLDPSFLECAVVRVPFVALLLVGLCVFASGANLVPFRTGMIVVIASLLVYIASYDKGYLSLGAPMSRALQWLGARSYAIYLLHIVAYMLMHQVAVWIGYVPRTPWGAIGYCGLAVVLILVLAEANYRLVEEPMRLRGRAIAERFVAG